MVTAPPVVAWIASGVQPVRLLPYSTTWVVAGCSAGKFRLWAFDQGRVDMSGLAFIPALRAHDQTEVVFRTAKPVEGFADNVFYIKINSEADGIVGGL